MKKAVLILWVIFVSLTFLFCKKDKASAETTKPVKEVRVTTEQKAYGYFVNGSYWIYKDSVTNTIDSFYVARQQVSYTERLINDTLFRFESINTFLAGATHSMIIGLVSDPVMYPDPKSVVFLTYSKFSGGPSVNLTNTNYSVGSASITSSYTSDSLNAGGKSYKHCQTAYFKHAIDSPNEFAEGVAQWQKNGGLIQLRSSIKQY